MDTTSTASPISSGKVNGRRATLADYAPSRALALALHEDYPDLDGLAYRSRHNNGEVCYALFDRVLSSDLVTLPGQRFEDDPARTDQLMRLHGAVFDTSLPIT
ncbi:RES family NAD+ phosphorylase [Sinorhizobium meliloti]|uniref:RES family NAD+ phosphorylase n=1 Tax=Rhizobium meliloti TaxID=382 RepID=UPI002D787892|nr:RES family NAD+ phosphorylase [Sinorhizobium meliloti]